MVLYTLGTVFSQEFRELKSSNLRSNLKYGFAIMLRLYVRAMLE